MSYQESISINEEEKKELISEAQAEEFATKQLNDKFNKQPGNITKTELRKDYISYEPRWIIFYDNNTQSETKISESTKVVKIKDENDYEVYAVEPRTRFVWNVQTKYESEFDTMVSYYVDTTTGELIGCSSTK